MGGKFGTQGERENAKKLYTYLEKQTGSYRPRALVTDRQLGLRKKCVKVLTLLKCLQ